MCFLISDFYKISYSKIKFLSENETCMGCVVLQLVWDATEHWTLYGLTLSHKLYKLWKL
jgi:hypothetical protein